MSHEGFDAYSPPYFTACWDTGSQPNSLDEHYRLMVSERASTRKCRGIVPGSVGVVGLGCPLRAMETQSLEDTSCSQTPEPQSIICADCNSSFGSANKLYRHAEEADHIALRCEVESCKATFSRLDTKRRHMVSQHSIGVLHPCSHCQKYQGENAFKRKDHLKQHMQNAHPALGLEMAKGRKSACPHLDCEAYRSDAFYRDGRTATWYSENDAPFTRARDYQDHMKLVHNQTPFGCNATDCDRKDANGFFRLLALEDHQRTKHPDVFASLKLTKKQWKTEIPPCFWHFIGPFVGTKWHMEKYGW